METEFHEYRISIQCCFVLATTGNIGHQGHIQIIFSF
jgi:hypothetical protein